MNKGWSSFMDRRVKERLVGASILMVVIVLFVPELLSGPKRAVVPPPPPGSTLPMRRVTIDLATNKTTAGSEPTASTAGAAGSGEPASSMGPDTAASEAAATLAPDAGTAGSAAPPAPASGATSPASATPPAPPPAADPLENGAAFPSTAGSVTKVEPTRRGWVAQVGSFAARDHAEKLERQLRSQGFSPVLSASGAGSNLRFRVRIGPVADRGAADKLVVKLGLAGHPATLVAP